eukprot:scaffold7797_cov1499-Pinguiococcus_pyrenoidosus.AAC.1
MLAETLTGVDVIVGGDSHSLLSSDPSASFIGNIQGEYPTELVNADGDKVCVVQAYQFATVLGSLSVVFDQSGVVQSCGGSPIIPFDDGNMDWANDTSDASGTLGPSDVEIVSNFLQEGGIFRPFDEDEAARAALAELEAQIDSQFSRVVGSAAEDLCYERIPGQGRSTVCDVEDTQANGGDITQLVARAYLETVKIADVTIQNAGGVRTDFAAGNITLDDIYTLLPFSNTLGTIEMTGAEITL